MKPPLMVVFNESPPVEWDGVKPAIVRGPRKQRDAAARACYEARRERDAALADCRRILNSGFDALVASSREVVGLKAELEAERGALAKVRAHAATAEKVAVAHMQSRDEARAEAGRLREALATVAACIPQVVNAAWDRRPRPEALARLNHALLEPERLARSALAPVAPVAEPNTDASCPAGCTGHAEKCAECEAGKDGGR